MVARHAPPSRSGEPNQLRYPGASSLNPHPGGVFRQSPPAENWGGAFSREWSVRKPARGFHREGLGSQKPGIELSETGQGHFQRVYSSLAKPSRIAGQKRTPKPHRRPGTFALNNGTSRRQPDLYWKQLQQLKAASVCIRLYRNQLAWRVRAVEVVKAVASSGSIAGWVVFREYPFLWSSIIVAAQLLDALKNVFPFARNHKSASDLTVAMELLWIDAEEEWESIYSGQLSEDKIIKRRTQLRKLQLDAERKYFPEGFQPSEKLVKLATDEASTYFALTYTATEDASE